MLRHVSRKSSRSVIHELMTYVPKTRHSNTLLQRKWISEKCQIFHSYIQTQQNWHPMSTTSIYTRNFSTSFQPSDDNLDNTVENDKTSILLSNTSSVENNSDTQTNTLDTITKDKVNPLNETKDQHKNNLTSSLQTVEYKDDTNQTNTTPINNVSVENQQTKITNSRKKSKTINQKLAATIRKKKISKAMNLLHDWDKANEENKEFINTPKIIIHMNHLVNLLSLTVKHINKENLISSLYIIEMIVKKEKQERLEQKKIYQNSSSQTNEDTSSTTNPSILTNNNNNDINIPLDINHVVPVSIYTTYCENIQKANRLNHNQSRNIIYSLFHHFKSLDYETYQKEIFPIFLISTLSQPYISIKRHGFFVWKYMQNKDIKCSNHILEEILKHSNIKQNQNTSIPFDYILEQLVNYNTQPTSSVVIEALKTQYPYKNTATVTRMLQSMKTLYEREITKKKSNESMDIPSSSLSPSLKYPHSYRIPIGTLEIIASSAAQTGSSDLILLIWDVAEMMGYRPTENLYESAIHGFINAYKQDHNAFAVISEMQKNGHTLSRPLTRFIAKKLSFSIARTNNAYYILSNDSNSTLINLSSLNCVLAAYATLGQIDLAFSTYDEFVQKGVQPNADTFSYLMEALVTNLLPSKVPETNPNQDQSILEQNKSWDATGSQIEAADSIISMMSKLEQDTNPYILHNHISVYIQSNELIKAKALLFDAVKSKQMILLQTFGHLIHHLLQLDDVDSAREICDWMREVAKEHGNAWKTDRDVVPSQLVKSIKEKAMVK